MTRRQVLSDKACDHPANDPSEKKKQNRKIEKTNNDLSTQNNNAQLEMQQRKVGHDVGKTSVAWSGLSLHVWEWRG